MCRAVCVPSVRGPMSFEWRSLPCVFLKLLKIIVFLFARLYKILYLCTLF